MLPFHSVAVEETILSPLCYLRYSEIITWPRMCEFIWGLFILVHGSICLFLCQYHFVSIATDFIIF